MEQVGTQIDWQRSSSELLLDPKLPSGIKAELVSWAQSHAEFPVVWLASSGTTGPLPKLIGLRREAILCSASAVNRWLSADHRDSWGLLLPSWHIGGLSIQARAFLSHSRVNVFPGRWQASQTHDWLISVNPNFLSLVPTQLHDWIQLEKRPNARLRALFIGGADLPKALADRAERLGWPVFQSYGMTETASMIAVGKPGQLRLLPHVEARVQSSGTLELRGPSLFTIQISSSGAFMREGDSWWPTSDLVELEGDRVSWRGRSDDVVKIKGKAYSKQNFLCAVSAFCEEQKFPLQPEAVIDLDDERLGKALILLFEGETGSPELVNLHQHFEASHPEIKGLSRWISSLNWPRTALGKIKQSEVRVFLHSLLQRSQG